MQKVRPDALTEDMIVEFVKPYVVEELGRIGSFENKKRISVKGEVTKVSLIFSHFLLMARLSETKKIMKDTFVMVLSFDFAEYNIYIVINTVQLFAIMKL